MNSRNGVGPVCVAFLLASGGLSQSGCFDLSESADQLSDQESNLPRLGGQLWATSQKDGLSFVINRHGQLVDTIALPGAGPHITTFSPSRKFAYIGGMLDGKLYVINARQRAVVTTVQVGPTLAHQAKPSPDGSTLLVSVLAGQSVVKVAVDEPNQTWTVAGSASTSQFGKPPICTVWRGDGQRAYVSMNPSGLAVLDVPTMTFLGEIPTDGFVACGMIKTLDGNHVAIASSGGGGHIYDLDLTTDVLTDRGTLGAPSWHSFIMHEDGLRGYGTSPLSDQLIMIDMSVTPVVNLGAITFASAPGTSDDQADAVGGGELLRKKTLAVSLRAAGNIAFVNVKKPKILSYLHLSEPAPFNPATCQDCAVHGVTIRPRHHAFDVQDDDDDVEEADD
jgi:DNA-binding beta-propeller fold protein YncE